VFFLGCWVSFVNKIKNDVDCENVGWVEQQRNPTQLEGVFLRMFGFLCQKNKK
jgi:hypothetical protein